mmetsp:Transcript_1830/g.4834  ORF Transcript_1830/g.4834 Transcript_1830/m.4834 type:complete len:88 (+) Transcript_1830:1601-1864(+)
MTAHGTQSTLLEDDVLHCSIALKKTSEDSGLTPARSRFSYLSTDIAIISPPSISSPSPPSFLFLWFVHYLAPGSKCGVQAGLLGVRC